MISAMRALGAAAAISLVASGALAAPAATAPLPAGKPAGVHRATLEGPGLLILGGLAIIGIGIAFAVSNNGKNTPTTPTTSATGTGV
jgi:hypothetical protein